MGTRRVRIGRALLVALAVLVVQAGSARGQAASETAGRHVALGGGLSVALDQEARTRIDALLADPGLRTAAGRETFVDALAGLVLAYAGDDPALADGIAAYARRRAPARDAAIAEALHLVRPDATARRPVGSSVGPRARRADAPGILAATSPRPRLPEAVAALRREGAGWGAAGALRPGQRPPTASARLPYGADAAGARHFGRTLSDGGLWGDAAFAPESVPALSLVDGAGRLTAARLLQAALGTVRVRTTGWPARCLPDR